MGAAGSSYAKARKKYEEDLEKWRELVAAIEVGFHPTLHRPRRSARAPRACRCPCVSTANPYHVQRKYHHAPYHDTNVPLTMLG